REHCLPAQPSDTPCKIDILASGRRRRGRRTVDAAKPACLLIGFAQVKDIAAFVMEAFVPHDDKMCENARPSFGIAIRLSLHETYAVGKRRQTGAKPAR